MRALVSLGDRMLNRLVPDIKANAAPDCWVDSELQGCGPGKYRRCTRSCCFNSGCGAWTCGGCAPI